jgi:hypothetical protein
MAEKCFLLHSFDQLEHTKEEFLEFCEQLKATEDIFIEHILVQSVDQI